MAVVQTLGPSAYLGFLEEVGEGRDARTHKALVQFHNEPSPSDCYVKTYCSRLAPKGLVNEVVGYALAKHGSFDVPRRAAVLLLDEEQARCFGTDFEPYRTKSGHVLAWCVESLGHPSPKSMYRLSPTDIRGLSALRMDLKKWTDLPDAISFDAWMLNDDRNPGNLIRLAEGRYALIDHGRVYGGNAWTTPLDRSVMDKINILALWGWEIELAKDAPKAHQAQLVNSFERHVSALEKASVDVDYWLGLLVHPKEKDDAEVFLEERVTSVPEYLRQSFGMLSL